MSLIVLSALCVILGYFVVRQAIDNFYDNSAWLEICKAFKITRDVDREGVPRPREVSPEFYSKYTAQLLDALQARALCIRAFEEKITQNALEGAEVSAIDKLEKARKKLEHEYYLLIAALKRYRITVPYQHYRAYWKSKAEQQLHAVS